MKFQMELSVEEQEILDGKKGETLQKAMKSVVLYGETFGARKLVPIQGPVHLVTSFGVSIIKPVFEMMDELIQNGLKTPFKFTVDPRPLDFDNIRCGMMEKLVFKFMYSKQDEYENQLKAVGLKNDNAFTCTCYMEEVGNIPLRGDILAWAESSAVVYANSVLGARTNRNSGVIELLSGIIGKTPYFGLLTNEGRKADWHIELNTSYLPDAQVLGSAIGMKVMEAVPYITGLERYLGPVSDTRTRDYLKDMGAATASNGAVGLYHVEGITPEALDFGKTLLKEGHSTYVIGDEEIASVIASYPVMWKNPDSKPQKCFIGCPHLSIAQIYDWLEMIKKELKSGKVAINTIFCAAPDVIEKFSQDKAAYEYMKSIGISLTATCPLMYMNNPLCGKHAVITNSNKLRTYSTARHYTDAMILRMITKGVKA